MVFSPGRLNLTWQYFQEVLLIWIALLSREKARLCLKDELWGPKKKEKKEKGRKWVPSSTLALILQHRCKEHLLCSLLSWIFCLFFFLPDKSSPLSPKYSLEQETRDSQVDVPAVKLWILSCYFWSSDYLCAKWSSRGRLECTCPAETRSQRGRPGEGFLFWVTLGRAWGTALLFLKGMWAVLESLQQSVLNAVCAPRPLEHLLRSQILELEVSKGMLSRWQ